MKVLVVTGGTSGLGAAICREATGFDKVVSVSNGPKGDATDRHIESDVSWSSGAQWVALVMNRMGVLPGELTLVNCVGVNHIDWFENLHQDDFDRLMDTNAKSIYLMTKSLLPFLKDGGTVCNIISNASHMPMTASLAYNMSKAAAHMATLQLARELTKRFGMTVFGVSPAKLAGTGMSDYIAERVPEVRGWTPEYAEEYQRNALLTGEEISPESVAEFICWLLAEKHRHFHLSGCVMPYGA